MIRKHQFPGFCSADGSNVITSYYGAYSFLCCRVDCAAWVPLGYNPYLANDSEISYWISSLAEAAEGTNSLSMNRPVGISSSRLVAFMKMRAEREAMVENEEQLRVRGGNDSTRPNNLCEWKSAKYIHIRIH